MHCLARFMPHTVSTACVHWSDIKLLSVKKCQATRL